MSDWASIATILAAVATIVGLVFIVVELVAAARAARAQATIMFQERFRESRDDRYTVVERFPLHVSLLPVLGLPNTDPPIRTWESKDELSDHDTEPAIRVINALNDVAQYVADGLQLRSALEQYHSIFLRLGFLLIPYLEQVNKPVDGRPRISYGRSVLILYNAAVAYHCCCPRHRDREITLTRKSASGEKLELTLINIHREGIAQCERFAGTPDERLSLALGSSRRVIRRAEAKLRQRRLEQLHRLVGRALALGRWRRRAVRSHV